GRPLLPVGIVPFGDFRGQLEDPCITVRTLELARAFQISKLAFDVGLVQMLAEFLPDEAGNRKIGESLEQPDERPDRIHGRMPVEASVKRERLLIVVGRTVCRFPDVASRLRWSLWMIDARQRHR